MGGGPKKGAKKGGKASQARTAESTPTDAGSPSPAPTAGTATKGKKGAKGKGTKGKGAASAAADTTLGATARVIASKGAWGDKSDKAGGMSPSAGAGTPSGSSATTPASSSSAAGARSPAARSKAKLGEAVGKLKFGVAALVKRVASKPGGATPPGATPKGKGKGNGKGKGKGGTNGVHSTLSPSKKAWGDAGSRPGTKGAATSASGDDTKSSGNAKTSGDGSGVTTRMVRLSDAKAQAAARMAQWKRMLWSIMFQGHDGAVLCCLAVDDTFHKASYSRGGRHTVFLLTGGADGDVRQYDVNTMQCVQVYAGDGSPIRHMGTAKLGGTASLAARTQHGVALRAHQAGASSGNAGKGSNTSKSKTRLLTVSAKGTISSFSTTSGLRIAEYRTGSGRIESFLVIDGLIYAGTDSGPVLVIDGNSGERLRTIAGHTGAVTGLAVSAKTGVSTALILITASADGSARITTLDDGSTLRMIRVGKGVTSIALINNSRTLVCACEGGHLKLFNVSDGQSVSDVDTGQNNISQFLMCGPNVAYAAGGSSEDRVTGINLKGKGGPRIVQRYHGHKARVMGIQVTDNKHLWTASEDGAAHWYALGTGKHLGTFRSFPREFITGASQLVVSWFQLLSMPLVWTDVGTALRTLRLPWLSDPGALSWLVAKLVMGAVLVVLACAASYYNWPKILRRKSEAAAAEGRVSRSEHLHRWRILVWLMVWGLTTVAFLPMIELFFSILPCTRDEDTQEFNFMWAAQTVPCFSASHVVMSVFTVLLLVFYVPLSLRLGRVDGKLEFIHRKGKKPKSKALKHRILASHWFHWGDDRAREKSDAMAKQHAQFDAAMTVSKLVLSFGIALKNEKAPEVAVATLIFALLLLVIFVKDAPYARPGVSHIYAGQLAALVMATACSVAAAVHEDNRFPVEVFLTALVPTIALGVGFDWFVRSSPFRRGGKRDVITPCGTKCTACRSAACYCIDFDGPSRVVAFGRRADVGDELSASKGGFELVEMADDANGAGAGGEGGGAAGAGEQKQGDGGGGAGSAVRKGGAVGAAVAVAMGVMVGGGDDRG